MTYDDIDWQPTCMMKVTPCSAKTLLNTVCFLTDLRRGFGPLRSSSPARKAQKEYKQSHEPPWEKTKKQPLIKPPDPIKEICFDLRSHQEEKRAWSHIKVRQVHGELFFIYLFAVYIYIHILSNSPFWSLLLLFSPPTSSAAPVSSLAGPQELRSGP